MKRHIGAITMPPRTAMIDETLKKDWAVRLFFDGGPDIPEDEGGRKSVRVSS